MRNVPLKARQLVMAVFTSFKSAIHQKTAVLSPAKSDTTKPKATNLDQFYHLEDIPNLGGETALDLEIEGALFD